MHSTKKSLGEYGEKLGAEDKEKIESAIKDLEAVLKDDTADKAAIDEKAEALTNVAMKLGEMIYADMQAKQQAAEAEGAAPEGGSQQEAKPKDDNVVDADFKEVKDK